MRLIPVLAAAVLAAALTGPASAADRHLLYFNHAYSVLDRTTADAIEHSDYLRDFANFEVRTTTGGGMTWTGRYLYGQHTYLELFGEGDLPGQDAEFGSAGMGVMTEHTGDLKTVGDRIQAQGITPATGQQTRDFGDGKPIPWFDYVRATSDQYDAFDPWGMEYQESYLADPRSKAAPASYPGDVSRDRTLSDAYKDHQMRDVTAIRIGVPQRDLTNTVPLLKAGGFKLHSLPTGITATDGGTTIRLDAVPRSQAGLKRVEIALNHPATKRESHRIGNSTLTINPGRPAVWTFDPRA